jgi:hypothetical protein
LKGHEPFKSLIFTDLTSVPSKQSSEKDLLLNSPSQNFETKEFLTWGNYFAACPLIKAITSTFGIGCGQFFPHSKPEPFL